MRFFRVFAILALSLTTASCVGLALEGTYAPRRPHVEPTYPVADRIEPLPSGSYKETCRECRFSRDLLSCSCSDVDGRWKGTSLNTKYCYLGVSNQNGRLICGAAVSTPIVRPVVLPRGSYSETCSKCIMNGTVLNCSCETTHGSNRVTSFDTRYCNSGVSNDDGRLICGAVAEKLPAGSYSGSCSNCKINNGLLACTCRDERGYNVSSSLYVSGCNQGVTNDNGKLICGTPRPKPVPLPTGSYRESCSECTMLNGTLSCDCRNENGRNVRSSLSTNFCYKEISNENGYLKCGTTAPKAGALPRGSYQQSCQSCDVSNNRLSCSCKDENGSSNHTNLSLQGCYSSIENCNGRLTCGDC